MFLWPRKMTMLPTLFVRQSNKENQTKSKKAQNQIRSKQIFVHSQVREGWRRPAFRNESGFTSDDFFFQMTFQNFHLLSLDGSETFQIFLGFVKCCFSLLLPKHLGCPYHTTGALPLTSPGQSKSKASTPNIGARWEGVGRVVYVSHGWVTSVRQAMQVKYNSRGGFSCCCSRVACEKLCPFPLTAFLLLLQPCTAS